MLKIGFVLLVVVISVQCFAQDTLKNRADSVHRNFIVNVVPNQYNKTLIGLGNVARGNQKGFHNGLFFNWNQKNLHGLQLGFFNRIGGSLKGLQFGIFNKVNDTLKGFQIGIVNVAKKRNKIQIGIINYIDTSCGGFSVGVFSMTRKGYQAIEIGVSEMYPVNLTYKIGHRYLYSSFNYSSNTKIAYPVMGFGAGSLITLHKSLFLNPDFTFQNGIFKSKQGIMSLVVKLSYAITKKIHLSAGPAFVWSRSRSKIVPMSEPMYSISTSSVDYRNSLVLGFRFSLRYNFRGL